MKAGHWIATHSQTNKIRMCEREFCEYGSQVGCSLERPTAQAEIILHGSRQLERMTGMCGKSSVRSRRAERIWEDADRRKEKSSITATS